jgi:DNA-binding transcriptional ArsR family regulator
MVWKGGVIKMWRAKGYDYETFRVFTKMRGSESRIRILRQLQGSKNRLQLAKELDMHWESISNHMDILSRYGMVEEVAFYGTTRYLRISAKGKQLLDLIAEEARHSVG